MIDPDLIGAVIDGEARVARGGTGPGRSRDSGENSVKRRVVLLVFVTVYIGYTVMKVDELNQCSRCG